MNILHRTHSCGSLTEEDVGQSVVLSGWVNRKRHHGSLIFTDLRDHYGITQLVFDVATKDFSLVTNLKHESIIKIKGIVSKRSENTINHSLSTGKIEVLVEEIVVESECHQLPLQVNSTQDYPEETRLKYRFLDLRRERLHKNIALRSQVINALRQEMLSRGFLEIQTPILTASSPEGARDYLVPSRVHKGKFYALPQAPQQFKQLLMIAGFDKYFQIAPCFRDEDARADRSPGEFYQLDIEMSFVTQEDIFSTIEQVLYSIFTRFSKREIQESKFPRLTYKESMLKYGTDKPDLRNPLIISDITDIFKNSGFNKFREAIDKGMSILAIPAPNTSSHPRSFFDDKCSYVQEKLDGGLTYLAFGEESCKGPIAKFLDESRINKIQDKTNINKGDSLFLCCDFFDKAANIADQIRQILGRELNLIKENVFKFCWITDFPYYQYDSLRKKIDFFHNPFSMPQGGLKALEEQNPLDILAYQYDIVCNGIELSSGAIRSNRADIMYKAFEIAGYDRKSVDKKFGTLVNAVKYGAPPHGGIAPGIDRIMMMLTDESNIREVVAFPMNQKAEDLLMSAPSEVSTAQLKELGINLDD
ncbi:aspartate--tRNA(Asp/Asn) ligase [Rickettsiales bacterium]|nr:aspartate--tRNA(Asp/Asn) ligase [Rickettsiales bacterium]